MCMFWKVGFLIFFLVLVGGVVMVVDYVVDVDLCIGIGGDGYMFLGVMVLFGMIQFLFDIVMLDFKYGYKWVVGYQYGDSSILGFLYMYFFGFGYLDFGDVLVMLLVGVVKFDLGDVVVLGSGYCLCFSYVSEVVQVGYYVVILVDLGVCVEFIVGCCVGWYCYIFLVGQLVYLLLDLCLSIYDYLGKVFWLNLCVCGDGSVIGCCFINGWVLGCMLCFVMCFLQLMILCMLYDCDIDVLYKGFKGFGYQCEDYDVQDGCVLEGVFDFGMLSQLLVVKVVIFMVSEVGVLVNFDVEGVGWDFNVCCQQVY